MALEKVGSERYIVFSKTVQDRTQSITIEPLNAKDDAQLWDM